MERAGVLGSSVSLAAHCVGVTILVTAPIVLPEKLPPFVPPGPGGPMLTHSVALSLGGAPARGGSLRPAPVRAEPGAIEPRLTAPAYVAPTLPEPTLELGGGPGLPGLPDDWPGGGAGSSFCLVGCGAGDGTGAFTPPATADPPSRPRFRVGGDIREPVKQRHVSPAYPPLAVATRVEGSVTLECVIDAEGRVVAIVVERGHPLLDAAAVEAVRQWRYRPTLLNGVPVSVLLTVTVDFRLR